MSTVLKTQLEIDLDEYPTENYDFGTSRLPPKIEPKPNFGTKLVFITGASALTLTIVSIPFIAPIFQRHCIPFVPATNAQRANVCRALQGRSGPMVDLGSGDGRIVIDNAKAPSLAVSHGIETNPVLLWYSRLYALLRLGPRNPTRFHGQDFWTASLQPYRDVVIFGTERREMLAELEAKILRECSEPDCQIVVCRFPLPRLQAVRCIGAGLDRVWVYSVLENRQKLGVNATLPAFLNENDEK